MDITTSNRETSIIRQVAGAFARHPYQVNGLLEADAEIIRLPGKEEYLVLKIDGIHEEIKTKLYDDPYLIGWMTVTAPISDLAAVGAVPTGILLSLILPQHFNNYWLEQFKTGICDACDKYKTYVLGGDTNFDENFSVSSTVIGYLSQNPPLLRRGMKPGHLLYTTASLGLGNLYAYTKFFDASIKMEYKPVARLAESKIISHYATACMDTSDGLFPALAVLSEINHIGFRLASLETVLHQDIFKTIVDSGIPPWMFLAGPHGEYELIFSIPPHLQQAFEHDCKKQNWRPIYLGEITETKNIFFKSESVEVESHPDKIPNLFFESGGNIPAYFELLMQQHKSWSKV